MEILFLHAVTDGILGACNLGDIGTKFPDTSKKYKNIREVRQENNIDIFSKDSLTGTMLDNRFYEFLDKTLFSDLSGNSFPMYEHQALSYEKAFSQGKNINLNNQYRFGKKLKQCFFQLFQNLLK